MGGNSPPGMRVSDFHRRNEQSRDSGISFSCRAPSPLIESSFRAPTSKNALDTDRRQAEDSSNAFDSRELSPLHLVRNSLPAVIMLMDCDSIASTASLLAQFNREKHGGAR